MEPINPFKTGREDVLKTVKPDKNSLLVRTLCPASIPGRPVPNAGFEAETGQIQRRGLRGEIRAKPFVTIRT